MKILLATESYYPNIDGGAIAQNNLVKWLTKKGHNLEVIAPGSSFLNKTEVLDDVKIHRTCAIPLPFYMNSRYFFSPFPLFKIGKIIRDFRPDVVHVCSPYPVGVSAMIWARKYNIPVLGSIHLLPENMFSPMLHLKDFDIFKNFSWCYLTYFFNLLDWNTIPTETGAKIYQKHGLNKKVTAISNGLDSRVFNSDNNGGYLRKKFDLPDKKIVLCTGRITEEKNLEVFIKSIPYVLEKIDAHFVLVGGGGEYKQRLIDLSDGLGVKDDITFTGFLDWEDYPNIYDLADVFALPAESELQSIVTLEAVSSGLPVVLVNKGALPELAGNNNGFLFPPKNSQVMADKIIKILSDDELRKKMAENSIELANKHSKEYVTEEYEKIYKYVIKHFS